MDTIPLSSIMAPAPPSHNALTLLTSRQEKTLAQSATPLELVLITAALLISSVLTLTPKNRFSRKRPQNPAFSTFVISIALLFTLSAFALAFTTLVLGWLRIISLDAVAGIVFALGPGFISIPLEILIYIKQSLTAHMMWANTSLNIPTEQFRYIRFIEANESQNNQYVVDTSSNQSCKWSDGNIMVIRFMPKRSRYNWLSRFIDNVFSCAQTRKIDNDPTALPPVERKPAQHRNASYRCNHLYGKHVKTYCNFWTVQDIDDGITSWWWSGVSSARHLVAQPSIVHMVSKRRVVNALGLLSDIISIGDLVFHFYSGTFEWMLKNDQDVRTAVTSAPGFSCNRILRELEMDGWDSVGNEVLTPDFRFPTKSRKRYSILFLILAEKSQRFLSPEPQEGVELDKLCSGQTVFDNLFGACDKDNATFLSTAKDSVDTWLKCWGLDIHEVESLRLRSSPSTEGTESSEMMSSHTSDERKLMESRIEFQLRAHDENP